MISPRRVGGAALGLAVTGAILFPTAADASSPDIQGWWSATNLGAVSVPAPDVPSDGLLVQGGALSPVAVAALVYTVPAGQTATSLHLTIATGSTATPTAIVQLCPLKGPRFTPAQGGPIADAPTYDCAKVSAVASVNADGVSFDFDAAPFVKNGTIAVALVAAGASDRVVFAHPGASSLVTQSSGSETGSAPLPDPTQAPPGQPEAGPVGGGTGSSDLPAGFGSAQTPVAPTAEIPTPVAAPETGGTPVAAASGDSAGPTSVPLAAEGSSGNRRGPRLVLLLLGLLVAGTLWLSQGVAKPEAEVEPMDGTPA